MYFQWTHITKKYSTAVPPGHVQCTISSFSFKVGNSHNCTVSCSAEAVQCSDFIAMPKLGHREPKAHTMCYWSFFISLCFIIRLYCITNRIWSLFHVLYWTFYGAQAGVLFITDKTFSFCFLFNWIMVTLLCAEHQLLVPTLHLYLCPPPVSSIRATTMLSSCALRDPWQAAQRCHCIVPVPPHRLLPMDPSLTGCSPRPLSHTLLYMPSLPHTAPHGTPSFTDYSFWPFPLSQTSPHGLLFLTDHFPWPPSLTDCSLNPPVPHRLLIMIPLSLSHRLLSISLLLPHRLLSLHSPSPHDLPPQQ